MCAALFTLTMPLMSFDWARIRLNFHRRYKWAFRTDYDNLDTPVVAQPELYRFMKACGESMQVKINPLLICDVTRLIFMYLGRRTGSITFH